MFSNQSRQQRTADKQIPRKQESDPDFIQNSTVPDWNFLNHPFFDMYTKYWNMEFPTVNEILETLSYFHGLIFNVHSWKKKIPF